MKFIDEDVIKGWEDKVNKKEAGQYFYPLVSYVKQMYLKVRAKALQSTILPSFYFRV